MSGRKVNVEFLLEIMKARTSTRQAEVFDDGAAGGPFCCPQNIPDHDLEVRDQPPPSAASAAPPSSPSSPPKWAFDYYGNPIDGRQQQQQMHQQKQMPRPTAASSRPRSVPFSRQVTQDDYSEFLDLNPEPTPKVEPRSDDATMDRGCVAEFGHCMQVTLCCAADDTLIRDAIAEDPYKEHLDGGLATDQEAMMHELNHELLALRQSTQEVQTAKAMRELELRAELADVRRQKAEMEEAYRREIAREVSQKVLLQAKLQQKLLAIMEERMAAEIQTGNVNNLLKNGSASRSPSTNSMIKGDNIPTALCTPIHQLSLECSSGQVAQPVSATTLVVSSQNQQHSEKADPPEEREAIDPAAGEILTPTSAMARASSPRITAANPFGLSIVVEEKSSSCGADPEGSPTPTTSSSGKKEKMLLSPTANRSPPASPQDPEGSVSGDLASPTAHRSGDLGSPTAHRSQESPTYVSLEPLPVATPVSAARFQAAE